MVNEDIEHGGPDIIHDTVKLLLDCKEKGQNLSNQAPPLIYMVPSLLRDVSPSSFNPRVVSIGPLHKTDEKVQEFEPHKACYLNDLMNRSGSPPERTLTECVHMVQASIDRIRACYGGMETYTDVELTKMMVMDGSFILEFLHQSIQGNPLISMNVILKHSIYYDLLLIENQIPFFVLQDIFDCTIHKATQTVSLTTMVFGSLKFLNPILTPGNVDEDTTPDHILGFIHNCFRPPYINPSTFSSFPTFKHSVLKLHRAGVRFKPYKDRNEKMAIKFEPPLLSFGCWSSSTPTLQMPSLLCDDGTEQFLRNIIAYEHCAQNVGYNVTSYVYFIHSLVHTWNDLEMLVDSNILETNLSSNQDAFNMINNMSKDVVLNEFCYIEQWQQLDRYLHGYWPKNIARCRLRYTIALVAIVVFALILVQTIFTIKAA